MTDNEFWEAIGNELEAAVAFINGYVNGFDAVDVVNGFQPNQQGAPKYPLCAFYDISATRYGWQGRSDTYNEIDEDFDHAEERIIERVIQISCAQLETTDDLSNFTGFDMAEEISTYLQTEMSRLSLLASGIGIITITDIRTPKPTDEADDFVQNPNFDITVNYTRITQTKVTPVTEQSGEAFAVPSEGS